MQISDLLSGRRRWPATAIQLTLLGMLSACGEGSPTEQPDIAAANNTASVGPSASAAQLSYDANYSIGFAQAVAAGVESAPEPVISPAISLTSTNSSQAIPTANSAESTVIIAVDNTNDTNTGTAGLDSDNSDSDPDSDSENSEPDATGNGDTPATDNSAGENPTEQPVSTPVRTDSDLTPVVLEPLPTTPETPSTDQDTGQDPATDPDPTPVISTTDTQNPTTAPETSGAEPEPVVVEQPSTDSDPLPTSEQVSATDPNPAPTETEQPPTAVVEPTVTDDSTPPASEEATETPVSDNESTDPVSSSEQTLFYSVTTPGFNGEVLTDSIRVTWPVDPNARGYNVYRQAEYVTSVFTEEYIDDDVYDSNYYYEIQAFDNDDTLYYVATGLTVKARTLGTTDPNAPVPNTQLLDGYDLVFSDEFNGSELDSTKWNTSYLWGTDLIINSEEQYYVDTINDPDFGFDPFTFDGENLTINSIKTPSALADKALNQPYLSGVITSYDAFKFTYGYIETRAKVTFGRGYWPAFWLLNAYYVDDKPEIDIMEFIGHDQDVVYHTYHYYDSEGVLRSTPSQATPGVDYTADFYTYAVEWKPGTLIFYIDNVEVHRVVDSKVSQQEMYVIANTALGGWWAGPPDNTTPFPGEFTLDYIRVYQKSQPYDDTLLDDGISQVPFADQIFGTSSPSHRPSIEDWPEGYPDGL